jgi:membrane protease YdiL (CAAX protease family)
VIKPWGRVATLVLGVIALMAGQAAGLAGLSWWYGLPVGQLPDFSGDGVAITVLIAVSAPVQVLLLVLFAQRAGNAADYLALTLPRRSDLVVGIIAVIVFVVVGNAVSLLLGRNVVTTFQSDIYRTASAAGWLLWLWLAISVLTPVAEEVLFRGFLFRGWLRSPSNAWPVIVVTALLWSLSHVQYDWYVISQVFVAGLLLGWLRWASGSTLLTILLHALINFEGMIETIVAADG